MKFTPSNKFLAIARSSYKVIAKKVYFRKTSTLSTALNSGTWIDATRFVDTIPDVTTSIETDLGAFTADAMPLTAKNIAWLNANIFNATSAEYIECKIEFTIGYAANDMASDVIYYFSGYVDKDTIAPGEKSDTITFTVDSADALMSKMDASAITTQYYEPAQAAIVLLAIPGVYVADCNIASYGVVPGIHTISYDYNNGFPQVRFNSGVWVPVSGGGTFTLGDGEETTANDRQRVSIKVIAAELQKDNAPREENIIITAAGTTLPQTWYTGIPVRVLANKIYTSIGITSQTVETLQTNTFDGTSKNVSFLGYANDGQSTANIGYSYGIAVKNATTVFVSSGNRVYSIDPTTGTVTYLFSVTAGYVISKLMYNSRNDHLWILFGNNYINSYGDSLARYAVGTATLSSTITVTNARHFSIELFDFQYFGGSYEYSLIYPETNNRAIKRVDGSTMTVTTLFTNTSLGYVSNNGPVIGFAYQTFGSGQYTFRCFVSDTGVDKVHEIAFETTAGSSWFDNGIYNTNPPFAHNLGGYIASEDKVFAFDAGTNDIRKYASSGASATDVITLDDNDVVQGIYSDGTYCFMTTKLRRYLHYFNNAGVNTVDVNMYCALAGFSSGNSRVYGVDIHGRVFQFHTVIERYVDQCIFDDKTLKNALTDALRATNCLATISFAKNALIYPRGNASGAPVTSGNAITVNVSNAADIDKKDKYGKAFDVVQLENGKSTINYDGTNFNVLLTAMNKRTLSIRNTLIPNAVIKDYCKNFFDYFSTARTLFTVPVLQTMFHVEPLDGATLDFTTTKITSTASNKPIYSATYKPNGTMKIGVLI